MSRVLMSMGGTAHSYEGTVQRVGFFGISVKGEAGQGDRSISFGSVLTSDFERPSRNDIKPGDHIRGFYSGARASRPYYAGEDDAFVISTP